jgi:chromosome partitioning protein
MRTIAIVNQKGGCGKTTTAINLAATFARRGRRTLLVDMDPQSHCSAGLGVPEQRIERSIGEVLLGNLDRPIDGDDFLWEVSRDLHLAPSTVSLAALEAASGGLSGLADRDRRLARALAWLRPRFDVCIVDCPPTIGLLTFNALRAADEVLVPVETGYFSLRGAEKQVATIAKTVERLGRPLPFRLLATLFDDRRAVDRDVVDGLRKRFGDAVLPVMVRDHEALREAASVGQAIGEYAPHGEADRDFDALAAWLLEHPPVAVEPLRDGSIPLQPALGGALEAGWRTEPNLGVRAEPRRGLPDPPSPIAAPVAVLSPVAEAALPTRAAELVRRVRELSGRPNRDELAMLHGEPLAVSIETIAGSGVGPHGEAMVPVRFATPRGIARAGQVIGDFNGWDLDATPMRPCPEEGIFEASVLLLPGRYRYRFVVDGRETLDPTNPRHEAAADGRDANVVDVPPRRARVP